jgi:phosphoribosylamine--glycine ligase
MLTAKGPRVLEYNCRFGDPETEVLLPLLRTPLSEVLLACCEGRLAELEVSWHSDLSAACVVMASEGYPGSYLKGVPVTGAPSEAVVFHAGTALQDGKVVTAGGRVLAVTATAPSLEMALARAYRGVEQIHFEGAYFRRDIGRPMEVAR